MKVLGWWGWWSDDHGACWYDSQEKSLTPSRCPQNCPPPNLDCSHFLLKYLSFSSADHCSKSPPDRRLFPPLEYWISLLHVLKTSFSKTSSSSSVSSPKISFIPPPVCVSSSFLFLSRWLHQHGKYTSPVQRASNVTGMEENIVICRQFVIYRRVMDTIFCEEISFWLNFERNRQKSTIFPDISTINCRFFEIYRIVNAGQHWYGAATVLPVTMHPQKCLFFLPLVWGWAHLTIRATFPLLNVMH